MVIVILTVPRCQLGSAPGSGPSTQMVTPGEATHRPDGDGGGGGGCMSNNFS